MPARGIHHIDLAVSDVERSLAFYRELLGPVGLKDARVYPTYRKSEEVVYFSFGNEWFGLRPADGGKYTYYDVGVEHIAFHVDLPAEVDAAYERAQKMGAKVHHPPEYDDDIEEYYALFVFDPDGFRIEVFSGPIDWPDS